MIFFDANFIISLYVKQHEHHQRASKIWSQVNDDEKIISNLIVPEVITVLNIKLKQNKDLLKKVYRSMMNEFVIVNDSDLFHEGFSIVLGSEERLPLFDGVYIAIMKDLKIKKIATFDKHFDKFEGIVRVH